ncbi:hypothetical protein FCU45_03040 [Sulfurimonas crateris]|uniref:Uncharacterized protein n=1 Tax=Sulfurimonas crateris TaxID=2574727 RepID=A0A4U2ZB22_9BACT|nr:hypothetical protein [Sulfurimonas crateris]TKI70281.1 hypothetical protein FCU45_03040 [Sulfurimonas crateris]
MRYSYQAEKLSAARAALMLPHYGGEAQSIVDAFHECSLAFNQFDESQLDETARNWIRKLKEFMDTNDVIDDSGEGTWMVKARSFSVDEQREISHIIDELASWFDMDDV